MTPADRPVSTVAPISVAVVDGVGPAAGAARSATGSVLVWVYMLTPLRIYEGVWPLSTRAQVRQPNAVVEARVRTEFQAIQRASWKFARTAARLGIRSGSP